MTKYRIRLLGGRVIGPFTKHQLFELKAKGHIKGNEEGQTYPTGNWGPLSSLDIYSELIDENRTFIQNLSDTEHTFTINLDELRNKRAQKDVEEIDVTSHVPMENMTETIRIPSATVQPKPVEIILDHDEPQIDLGELPDGLMDDSKTLINPVAQQELEKMRKLQREAEAQQAIIEAENKRLVALERATLDEEAKQLAMVKAGPDALTVVVKLEDFKDELIADAKQEEKLINKQRAAYERKLKAELSEEDGEQEEAEKKEEQQKAEKNKRIKLICVIGLILLGYAYLFPEGKKDKEQAYENLPPQIIFPIPFDKADRGVALASMKKGFNVLTVGPTSNS